MPLRRKLVLAISFLFLAMISGWSLHFWRHSDRTQQQPIVIMIGLDGFRPDYLEKYKPPVLNRLAKEGVTTSGMRPSFPTLTFPNFYTLATGLYPENHGIIGNSMYDPEFKAEFSLGSPAVTEGRWWGGEPIWVTAQRQGLKASCMFWPGSEAEINGIRPTNWRAYDGKVTPEERVHTVLEWLAKPESSRPRLITLYFHEADSAGHRFGPDSVEVAQAVALVDKTIGDLIQGLEALNLSDRVNLVFCSDHGMTALSPDRVINLASLVDPEKVKIDFSGPLTGLRPKEGADMETPQAMVTRLKKLEEQHHFKVYLREETPPEWHFRNHRRIPPVLLLADEGWFVIRKPMITAEARQNFLKGTHGFSPELPSMQALFIASGPAFKKGINIPSFQNVELYSLVCALLGISPAANDGHSLLLPQVLKAGSL